MCTWKSKINPNIKCDRNKLDDSDFCLFHKPNKNLEEGMIFWKIVNFNSTRAFTPQELYIFHRPWEYYQDEELKKQISEKYDLSILSNFTKEEREKSGFELLKKKILEEVNSRARTPYNYKGFIFPESPDMVFNCDFLQLHNGAEFMDFSEAIFEGGARFDNFTFKFPTSFNYCQFKREVSFYSANFIKRATFINVSFSNIILGDRTIFEETLFSGSELLFENNSSNQMIDFGGIKFGEQTKFILNLIYPKRYGVASYGEKAFRLARIQSSRIGDHEKEGEYRYIEKCYASYQILPEFTFWDKHQKTIIKKFDIFRYLKDEITIRKLFQKILDFIVKNSIGYGEKPKRAMITFVSLLFTFAFIFMFLGDLGIKSIDNETKQELINIINYDISFNEKLFSVNAIKDFGNCLYFSIVTFTTVGYGDITPTTGVDKIISGLEMFFGVTFVGAWTATLLRKFFK